MDIAEFLRVLTTFADTPTDLNFEKGRLFVQVREEVIEASLTQAGGTLTITELGSIPVPAFRWLIDRVARVPQLTDRILSYLPPTPFFVTPRGLLLEQLDVDPADAQSPIPDAAKCMLEVLNRRPAGTSTVLYLTSDAGEGKTTVITEAARNQALAYKKRTTDWLLIPINLGGRPFMRFDDVVIGALVNRLRFPFFYYDAFIELVRLGVLIPAFDGFEEVFVEGGSGEALSALGNLVNTLRSSGSMLISARKAYFEYRDFAQTARLFDAIGTDSVGFARLSLSRWNRDEFQTYGRLRQVPDVTDIYERAASRLGADHPLLTRAVLVRRLFDVVSSLSGSDALIERLGSSSQDYFYEFINAIIEREAKEKWIDRSGKISQPLISIREHHELLSMIALEMWLAGTELLRKDVLDVIADVFAEHKSKTPAIARQVKERLPQHALLSTTDTAKSTFAFDHEDFRRFFLGEAIGQALVTSATDLTSALQKGSLPVDTVDSIAQFVRRTEKQAEGSVADLLVMAQRDHSSSFARENCAAIIIRLLDGHVNGGASHLSSLTFASDTLRGRALSQIIFEDCYFQSTSLAGTALTKCIFRHCRFETVEMHSTTAIRDCVLDDCQIGSVVRPDNEVRIFDPAAIVRYLTGEGFQFLDVPSATLPSQPEVAPDERTVLVQRALRLFLRNTHVNESAIRVRMGVRANEFIDGLLPILLRLGVLEEVQYHGSGKQRRFRLCVPMQRIDNALRASSGDFEMFLVRITPNGLGA